MSNLLPNKAKHTRFSVLRRFLAILLILALTLPMLSGCGLLFKSRTSEDPSSKSDSSQSENSDNGSSSSESDETSSNVPQQESSGHDDSSQEESETNPQTQAQETGIYFDESGIDYDRLLATKNQAYTEGSGTIYPSEGLTKSEKARYTLMIYMTGSNLESVSARATLDLLEMQDSGLSFDDCNVIIYAGGCQAWKNNIPSSSNSVIDLSLDPSEYIIASTQGNADMGAPETLREFINFTTDYFPADHYSLIFWDHGGGPLWGYGSDELFGGDSLLLSEMKEAMDQTIFAGQAKLDIVGFDACLMGSYEVMCVFADYASYMIASEELEPGAGWDYHFLSILNQTSDPKLIGKKILDDFLSYYKQQENESYHPQITLSQIDLSKISSLTTALESVFNSLTEGIKTGKENEFRRIRLDSKSFGVVETRDSGTFYYDLVDLNDLLDALSSLYKDSCNKAITALKSMVVDAVSTMENTGGVSLYYPCYNKGQYEKLGSIYRDLSASSSYLSYLDSTTATWLYSKSRDWKLGEIQKQDDELTLQLTPEQLSNVSACYYNVLLDSDTNGVQSPAVLNCKVFPDEDGVLHIPYVPTIFYPAGTKALMSLFAVKQIEKTEDLEIYQTVYTSLYRDIARYYRYDPAGELPVTITFSYAPESGETTVLSIVPAQSEFSLGGKESIDFSQWQAIIEAPKTRAKLTDREGRVLPYSQWTIDSTVNMITEYPFSGELAFDPVPASHTFYSIQIVIEDSYGEQYATDVFDIYDNQSFSNYTTYTDNGSLSYYIYSDHAEVSQYEGSDTTLIIPETVRGVPVTDIVFMGKVRASWTSQLTTIILPSTLKRIHDHAFNGLDHLTTIELPEGLEFLGNRVFNYCLALESVTIPSSVTRIGDACFDGCASLKSVKLPPSLEYLPNGLFIDCPMLESIEGEAASGYRIISGALYNEDGTILAAYPAAKAGSFTVPQGTVRIAFAAFYKSVISQIILPEGLIELAPYAFFGCEELAFPSLPASLEKIGYKCFGSGLNMQYPSAILPDPVTIKLGKNITYIGDGSFDVYLSRIFEVDEDSPFFSVVDGNLTNKAQDTLIQSRSDKRLKYQVPDGIVSFNYTAFSFLSTIITENYVVTYDLFLPDSLTDIAGELPVSTDLFVFHSRQGTYAQQYAISHEIPWDSETSIDYYVTEVSTGQGTLYARVYDDHAMVFLYIGLDSEVTIPETIDSMPVTVLGNGLDPLELTWERSGGYFDLDFRNKTVETTKLASLKIPDSVTTFSSYCFSFSDALAKTLEFPASLTIIGDHALPSFDKTRPLVLPDSLEYLGENSLGFIEKIPISEKTKYINPKIDFSPSSISAFVELSPNEQYSVKDGSLYSKDEKTLIRWGKGRQGPLTLPEGIITIGPYAFYISNYTSITLPRSLESIETYAFSGGTFTSISFPENVKTIGDYAFFACPNLETVSFNEGLTYIGDSAFGQTAVSVIQLPDSVTYIGSMCFSMVRPYSCLKEGDPYTLTIGPNLRYIGDLAFNCLPIKAYEVHPDNPSFSSCDGILYDYTRSILIDCPCAKEGEIYLSKHTSMISNFAFFSCLNVTDLYVPECVTAMQQHAFIDFYYVKSSSGEYVIKDGYWITCHVLFGLYAYNICLNYGMPYVTEQNIKTFKE